MEYVRGMNQLAGMEGWSEEKWWCGRAGGAAWVGGCGPSHFVSTSGPLSAAWVQIFTQMRKQNTRV